MASRPRVNEDKAISLVEGLYKQSRQGQCTNFVIRAGDVTCHCHKMVLCCTSKFFEKICEPEDAEEYVFEDFPPFEVEGVLPAVVRMFYLGSILVTDDNVVYLLRAAHKIRYPKLARECQKFLMENLTQDNCKTYQGIADKFRLGKLKDKCAALVKEKPGTEQK